MSVKTKWRLPADVTKLNPDQLNRSHLLTMLDFLGYPISRQPRDKKAKCDMLLREIGVQPERAQQAYDVIVFAKLPETTTAVTEGADAMRAHFQRAMQEILESEQSSALEHKLGQLAEGLKKNLEGMAKEAMREAAEHYRPVVIKQGKETRKVKGVLPHEFERMVQLASQRIPMMLVGPAGCGKTYLAGKVAEALDLEFYDQSCSEGVSESIFTGWLLPVASGGSFDYVPAPFINAYEKGGVFLLDEMDAADPNLLTFLNKAIANDFFFLPQRHKKPKVMKHKDFVVIAAANTFGNGANAQYVGRNALDAATLDRFRAGMLHLDYSAEVEEALVDSEVLAWGRKVRECINRNKFRRIMSTRVMLDLTKMTQNCDWKLADWERSYFADWSADELSKWRVAA